MNLLTSRLEMAKYKTIDFEYFCDVICNDEVMFYISGTGNSREVAKEKYLRILKTNQENEFYGLYKVIQLTKKKVIGFAKIVPYEKDCLEIGYALLAPYWRKGFTIEMIEKMTNHCLQYFPDKKIMAIVNKENVGSLNVLERCNYKEYQQKDFKGAPCIFLDYRGKQ